MSVTPGGGGISGRGGSSHGGSGNGGGSGTGSGNEGKVSCKGVVSLMDVVASDLGGGGTLSSSYVLVYRLPVSLWLLCTRGSLLGNNDGSRDTNAKKNPHHVGFSSRFAHVMFYPLQKQKTSISTSLVLLLLLPPLPSAGPPVHLDRTPSFTPRLLSRTRRTLPLPLPVKTNIASSTTYGLPRPFSGLVAVDLVRLLDEKRSGWKGGVEVVVGRGVIGTCLKREGKDGRSGEMKQGKEKSSSWSMNPEGSQRKASLEKTVGDRIWWCTSNRWRGDFPGTLLFGIDLSGYQRCTQ